MKVRPELADSERTSQLVTDRGASNAGRTPPSATPTLSLNDERTPAGEDAAADAAILTLLLDDEHQHPWAEAELARDFGDELTVTDSLSRLERTGLVHRHAGFVSPTRAARRAAQLMR